MNSTFITVSTASRMACRLKVGDSIPPPPSWYWVKSSTARASRIPKASKVIFSLVSGRGDCFMGTEPAGVSTGWRFRPG